MTSKIIILIALIGVAGNVAAQKHPAPWALTREDDKVWRKIAHRQLDVYVKQNAELRNTGKDAKTQNIGILLRNAVLEGRAVAYADTNFQQVISKDNLRKICACQPAQLSVLGRYYWSSQNNHEASGQDIKITFPDSSGAPIPELSNYHLSPIPDCVFPQQVEFYELFEHWYFDRVQGKMVGHVAAIAPGIIVNGQRKTLFWLKYPELRDYLSNFIARSNTVFSYSWEEYFEMRLFVSTITCSYPEQTGARNFEQVK